MSDTLTEPKKSSAVRLSDPLHQVLSILAARRRTTIKALVEQICSADPDVKAQAEMEMISLAVPS